MALRILTYQLQGCIKCFGDPLEVGDSVILSLDQTLTPAFPVSIEAVVVAPLTQITVNDADGFEYNFQYDDAALGGAGLSDCDILTVPTCVTVNEQNALDIATNAGNIATNTGSIFGAVSTANAASAGVAAVNARLDTDLVPLVTDAVRYTTQAEPEERRRVGRTNLTAASSIKGFFDPNTAVVAVPEQAGTVAGRVPVPGSTTVVDFTFAVSNKGDNNGWHFFIINRNSITATGLGNYGGTDPAPIGTVITDDVSKTVFYLFEPTDTSELFSSAAAAISALPDFSLTLADPASDGPVAATGYDSQAAGPTSGGAVGAMGPNADDVLGDRYIASAAGALNGIQVLEGNIIERASSGYVVYGLSILQVNELIEAAPRIETVTSLAGLKADRAYQFNGAIVKQINGNWESLTL